MVGRSADAGAATSRGAGSFNQEYYDRSDGKIIPLGSSSVAAVTPSGKMAALNTDLGFLLRFAYDNAHIDRPLIWLSAPNMELNDFESTGGVCDKCSNPIEQCGCEIHCSECEDLMPRKHKHMSDGNY